MRWIPPVYSPAPLGSTVRGAFRTPGQRERDHDRLERELGDRYGAPNVTLWASATDALTALFMGIGGDGAVPRIAVPAYSCYDLATALLGAGATPVFYDLDPHTLQPCHSSLDVALDATPSALVVAPLFGIPADMERITARASDRGVLLVVDAAQAFESFWQHRPVASWGDATVLSFGRGKGWTGGGGGALLRRAATLDLPLPVPAPPQPEPLGLLRLAAQELLCHPAVYGFPARLPGLALGETVLKPARPPEGSRPGMAGVVLRTEPAARLEAGARKLRGADLARALEGEGPLEPVRPLPGAHPSYLRLPALAPCGAPSRQLRALGVMPGYPRPLHQLDLFTDAVLAGPLTGAESLAKRLVTLPTHGRMGVGDMTDYATLLRRRFTSESREVGTPV